ncbi:MAG: tetratricopeptide repeat protein [Candidatus Woesearchaeota archaeon]
MTRKMSIIDNAIGKEKKGKKVYMKIFISAVVFLLVFFGGAIGVFLYKEHKKELAEEKFIEGLEYFRHYRYFAALMSLEKSIEMYPTDKAYLLRGICWLKVGDQKLAQQDFKMASRTENKTILASSMAYQGFIYMFYDNDLELALQKVNQAEQILPTYEVLLITGAVYLRANQTEVAMDYASRALEMNPLRPDAYALKGRAYQKMNDEENASFYFQKALDINPEMHKDPFYRYLQDYKK